MDQKQNTTTRKTELEKPNSKCFSTNYREKDTRRFTKLPEL